MMKFLAPFFVTFALIPFSDPEGKPVYVVRDQITSVSSPVSCDHRANAKITLNGTFLCVKETVAQVLAKLSPE